MVRLASCDGGWPWPVHVDKTHISGDFTFLLQRISVYTCFVCVLEHGKLEDLAC